MVYNKRVRSLRGRIKGVKGVGGWRVGSGRIRGVRGDRNSCVVNS
jgi:hypothetical protein